MASEPGSDEAIRAGCTCPQMDNHYGAGFQYGDQTCWYIIEAARTRPESGMSLLSRMNAEAMARDYEDSLPENYTCSMGITHNTTPTDAQPDQVTQPVTDGRAAKES